MHRASKTRLGLHTCFTVAGLALAAVFCTLPAQAQDGGFAFRPPARMVAVPVENRRFDIGFGVDAADGSIPVPGKGTHACLAGFKYGDGNEGLSRAEINRLAATPEWRGIARAIMGVLFSIQSERNVMVNGHRGLEMAVTPRIGPDAENTRGLITIIDTAKGRLSVVCITTAAAFARARGRFAAVPHGARLPE